ncbi:bacteriocin immunity protein [Sporolactobacillus laevolacticus]|uniref:Uncharacterized protein n=1 Tax=Sporolactobacillus laevolacticus DSM 442 TaxID=1395513 RepID=V6ITW5_9BACL|nr:bacteriocin immunity protein [Sporolactobacillus laevolacticus]EST10260.1 hypothetical protein P343_18115 [Sporolactobacillus laevolacticus DSM 442]
MKADKRTAKAIELLNWIEGKCDPSQHQPLIDLFHDYKRQLNTNDNKTTILAHFTSDLSACILENHLKAPKEISDLIQAFSKLIHKDLSIQLTEWLL